MKCVKNPIDDQIKRLPDHEAKRLLAYGWLYISKGEWKKHIRPKPAVMREGAAKAAQSLIDQRNLRRL